MNGINDGAGSGRRNFLKAAGLTALGAGCFLSMSPQELRALVAKAAASSKPLLTQASLNGYIASVPKSQRQQVAQQAMNGLSAFLNAHFTVAAPQQAAINSLGGPDLAKIEGAIRDAIAKDKQLDIKLPKEVAHMQKQSNSNPKASVDVNSNVTVNVVTVNC